MNNRSGLLAGVTSAMLLVACSSSNESDSRTVSPDGTLSDRKLKTLDSDSAFLEAVRGGLLVRPMGYLEHGFISMPTIDEAGSDAISAADSDTSGAESATESSSDVTSTNVQEQGVDEQDWVKVSSDGQRLFVLNHGTWGDVDIGLPMDAEVTSSVGDMVAEHASAARLRVLQLDAASPDSRSISDFPLDLNGRYANGFYLFEGDEKTEVVLTATGDVGWAYWTHSEAFGDISSSISRIDVSDPANMAVNGTLSVDGQIVSSRRIGQYLFLATRFYPHIDVQYSGEQTEEQWRDAVENASAEELLPHYRSGDTGEETPLIDPANCFVADSADDDFYSPDIVTLAVVDLVTLELTDSECYLGSSETLYASPQAVYLATTRYDYSSGPVTDTGELVSVEDGVFPADGMFWSDPRADTDIHQFDIDAGQLRYAGTGTVSGHLGWNSLRKPFRMSEKNGYLRVATFNDQQGTTESPILLTVLQASGNGVLDTVSTLPNASEPAFIGKPGEQLYASRFLGDRAYLVTFRQTDPLYVIDLADPANPAIAGELEIQGYSDYLHPIGDDYLLGIGRDAVAPQSVDDQSELVRGALVQGIKLSLFDVSNPNDPQEVQSLLVGQRGSHSMALSDHRAITVQPASDDHPTRVSIGIAVHGEAFPSTPPSGDAAWVFQNWNYTGLHGFEVSTGADAGITSVGALVARTADTDPGSFYYYSDYANDRSVLVNDSVFYIYRDEVYAAPWNDLATPSPAR